MVKFVIRDELPTLNEWNLINRANKYAGNSKKADVERRIMLYIREQIPNVSFDRPIFIRYKWVCKNRKKDKDNIAFAKKFIQDAMVKAGVIKNDGWNNIVGWSDHFEVDPDNPRIEVAIRCR